MKYILLFLIKIYQLTLSPERGLFRNFYFLPAKCHFEESCSKYAYRVIKEQGSYRGLKLTVSRLSQCHPF